MKKILFYILLIPFLASAQKADTTFADYIRLGDAAFDTDIKYDALVYYVSAINIAQNNGIAEPEYPGLIRAAERSSDILILYESYEDALLLYNLAHNFARDIKDNETIYRIIPKKALVYTELRKKKINIPPPEATSFETAEVFYQITKVPEIRDGVLYVTINGGITDGVYAASTGFVYGTYSKTYKDRENLLLGEAIVERLDTGFTVLKITPLYEQTGINKISKGDMVKMLSRIPKREYKSILWELALMHIYFYNINNEPMYDYRMLLLEDNQELEAEIIEVIRRDIQEIYEWLMSYENKEEYNNIFNEILPSGRYKGMKPIDVLGKTNADDIRSFLAFVKSFPGKYMGKNFKINETYATWIINNSPIGFEEFLGYFMKAQTTDDYKKLIEQYDANEFLAHLNVLVDKKAEQQLFEEAIGINNKCLKLAELLPGQSFLGWVYFSYGRIYDHLDKDDSLQYYYEKAIPIFEATGDTKGVSFCLNNLASVYQNKKMYAECLSYYQRAYNKKLELLTDEQSDRQSVFYNLAKSALGIGNSHYYLANYDSALTAYHLAVAWCDSAQTLEAKIYAASIFNEIAKVYKKRAQFDEATQIYKKQIPRFTELGDVESIASTYDNMADVLFSLGSYQEAYDMYMDAYKLKIDYKDWNDAGFSMGNCGQAMWNLGKLDSAIACHNNALELRRKANNKKGEAYSLSKIAALYQTIGQPEKAETYYQQSVDMYTELGDSVNLATVATSVGKFYYEMKNYTVAVEFFDFAELFYRNRSFKSELADVYSNKGEVYMDLKNYNEAKSFYIKALSLRREMNERQNIMYSLVDLSIVLLYGEHKMDTAKILLDEALLIAKETGSVSYQAFCYQSIGNSYSFNALIKQAEENYRKAYELYKQNGDISEQCKMLRYLGSNEAERGNFAEAKNYYSEALNLAITNKLRLEIAHTYNYLSEFYYSTGEFKKAFSVIDSAFQIYQEDNNLYGIANAHIVYGNTHNLIGNGSKALEHYQIADSIFTVLEDPLSRSTCINNMGTIAFMQGDYDKCLTLFNSCLQLLDSSQIKLSLAIILNGNIGEVYMERGIWEEAENYINRSIKLAEEMGITRHIWGNRIMLGKLKSKQEKYQETISITNPCYDVFVKSDEKMAIAEAATVLGKAYHESNNPKKAREFLNVALKTYRDIGSKKLIWEPLYYLALVECKEGNTMQSITYLKEAVDTLERLSSDIVGSTAQKKLFAKANNKKDIYQLLITQLVLIGEIKEAWVYQEKLNVYGLEEQTRGEPTRGAQSLTNDEMQLAELELKKDGIYNQLMLEKAKPVNERKQEKIAELEKMMSIASDDYQNFFWELIDKGDIKNDFANTVNPEDLDQKRYNLDEDMAVLQYLIAEDKLIIFIASKDTLGAKVVEVSQTNLDSYINAYYNQIISKAGTDLLNPASEKLYNVLIEPVKPLLKDKKKIAFVPTGLLIKLPFQSLGYTKNNAFNYIGNDYDIFYINDMSYTVIEEPLNINAAKFMAFGNADNTLPFAEKEVNTISQLFTTPSIYLKSEATEDIAKNNMNNFSIVHFATHGNLDPINFNNSYLTLAPNTSLNEDGQLTMNEINRLRTLRGCQLIVLSACNTAVNDEKLNGWINNPAKAFLRKGAKSAIASLWAVDDAATGELMNNFYKNLLAGQNKVTALSNAQKSLMLSDKFKHPYYWAAFELIGQWE